MFQDSKIVYLRDQDQSTAISNGIRAQFRGNRQALKEHLEALIRDDKLKQLSYTSACGTHFPNYRIN